MRINLFSQIFILAFLCACNPMIEEQPNKSPESETLAQLETEAWEKVLETDITFRVKVGLPITEMPDYSYEKAKTLNIWVKDILQRAMAIDRNALDPEEQTSLDVLIWQLSIQDEAFDFFWFPFLAAPYMAYDLTAAHQTLQMYFFKTKEDTSAYLTLLDKYIAYIDQIHQRYKDQAERGIHLPRPQIDPIISMYQTYLKTPEESLFYVSEFRLDNFDVEFREAYQAEVTKKIKDAINPAYERFISWLDSTAREQASDDVGLHQYPNGKDYYRHLVRFHSTMDVTPEEVHQMGIGFVQELNVLIEKAIRELGSTVSRKEFVETLQKDERFYAKDTKEIGERLMFFVNRLEPEIDRFFSYKPDTPYGVAPLPADLEGSMTFGYYHWPTAQNPTGTYLFNGSDPENTLLLGAEALIYHELVPGHHFQIGTQVANTSLSEFRRGSFHGAYVEGWANYASDLGLEMGGYRTPHDRLGLYFLDMFMSVRLVVDTGMNYFGWTREQAMNYMRDNLIEDERQIQTESLRYSVLTPGQALGYKIGNHAIHEFRKKAEQALGDRFDPRQFHSEVLATGSLPLPILEKRIDRYISRVKNQ